MLDSEDLTETRACTSAFPTENKYPIPSFCYFFSIREILHLAQISHAPGSMDPTVILAIQNTIFGHSRNLN